ncbi:MAG TPA: TonB-dependent receptor [Sphingobium sp.]|nr:TonB-dependent receptor [Sphingobium sp.]
MKGLERTILLASASVFAGMAMPALAQPGEGASNASDIIVTARRVEERLQDVPLSISVFNQDQLTSRNVTTASDLATYVPSLSQNNTYGADNARFQIRGFTQDAETAPSVGVYFADAVAPRGASNAVNAGGGAGPGSFFDLANVQVLKGPQGTLFGRNTTGGAILLVPQKPTGRFEGYVEGSVGNYDMRRIQAVVNVPVMDTLRVRFGIDRQTRDGFLHNYSGIGPKDLADIDYWAGRASIVADLTPNLENYLVATYSRSDTSAGAARVVACNPNYNQNQNPATNPDPVGTAFVSLACGNIARREAASGGDPYGVMQPHANPHSLTEQWQLINTTTWNVSDNLTVKNILSYGQFRQNVLTDFFGTDFLTTDLDPNAPPLHFGFATIGGLNGGNLTNQSTFTEELQFQGRAFDNRLNWVAGFFTEASLPLDQSGNSPPTLLSCTNFAALQCTDPLSALISFPNGRGGVLPPGTIAVGSMGQQQSNIRYYNYAVFAQATYDITDQLKITGGFRYTWDITKNTTTGRLYQFQPMPNYGPRSQQTAGGPVPFTCLSTYMSLANGCTFTFPDAKSEAPTWVIDLVYQPTPDLMAYAKYGRGYRASFISATNPVLALTNVRPEKLNFYEVGFKSSFSGAVKGMLNVAAFYNDFTDQQIQLSFTPTQRGLPRSASAINAGQSETYGVEVDASLQPFEGFNIQGSYAWLKTKIKQVPNLAPLVPPGVPYLIVPDFQVGDPLVLAPENKFSITASYTLPLDPSIGKITLAGTFTHTDSQLSNYKDRLSVAHPMLRQYSYLPAHDLVNLNLNWNSVAGSPVDLSLFATNVTKEYYYVFTPGVGQASPLEVAQLGEPRTYGLRLKYRFGGN